MLERFADRFQLFVATRSRAGAGRRALRDAPRWPSRPADRYDRDVAGYEIAQLNVGRARGPMDGPVMADFAARLDEINALAESAPGFVWRLKGDNNNATELHYTDDPMFIVNLTVWRSIDELWAFTYATHHNQLFKRRFEWFERSATPTMTMWWQPAGTIPEIQDALRRLRHLTEHGPTPEAFTFKQRFPAPEGD